MDNKNEEKKVSYTSSVVIRYDSTQPSNSSIAVEGFAESLSFQKTKVKGEEILVANLELTAVLPDSRVRWLFGDELVNERHKVRFHVSFWGKNAESIRKYPPYKGQMLFVGMTSLRVTKWTGDDGKVRYVVYATSNDGIGKRGWKKEDAEPFSNKIEDEPASVVSVTQEYIPAETFQELGVVFTEMKFRDEAAS